MITSQFHCHKELCEYRSDLTNNSDDMCQTSSGPAYVRDSLARLTSQGISPSQS